MTNISNLSKVFQTKHLADLAQELSKSGLTDYQKCVLLSKARPFLGSSRKAGRNAILSELVSLVEFTDKGKNYNEFSKPSFYRMVEGLHLNDYKESEIQSIKKEFDALRRRQEKSFSKTAKAIQEKLDRDRYKNHFAQASIILANTEHIVSQGLRSKFRKKLFKGSESTFSRCKFLCDHLDLNTRRSLYTGELSASKIFKELKESIKFSMTVEDFRDLLMEKKSPKIEPKTKVKIPIPVRCLFRLGRIELNWKQKRRASEEVSQAT